MKEVCTECRTTSVTRNIIKPERSGFSTMLRSQHRCSNFRASPGGLVKADRWPPPQEVPVNGPGMGPEDVPFWLGSAVAASGPKAPSWPPLKVSVIWWRGAQIHWILPLFWNLCGNTVFWKPQFRNPALPKIFPSNSRLQRTFWSHKVSSHEAQTWFLISFWGPGLEKHNRYFKAVLDWLACFVPLFPAL